LQTRLLALAATIAMLPMPANAQDGNWQVGTSPSFSSGRYGTELRTTVFHTPITARRLFADGDVTLVFPFTCVSGNGLVTIVDGTPVRNQRTDTGSLVRGGGSDVRSGTTSVSVNETSSCGMGDIVVRGRYYVLDERGWLPTIAVRGHVKAPTASAERGLGTGRPDEGIGIEVSRSLGAAFLAMLDGGYTLIGEPAGVSYNDNWWYEFGLGRDFANGLYNLSAFYAEDRAFLPGLSNAKEVLAAVSFKGTQGWRFQVSGQYGLSDGAPDHGITLGASRRF
jgi:hypothetical protein